MQDVERLVQAILKETEKAVDILAHSSDVEAALSVIQARSTLIERLAALPMPTSLSPSIVGNIQTVHTLETKLENLLLSLNQRLVGEIKEVRQARSALNQWGKAAGLQASPDQFDFLA